MLSELAPTDGIEVIDVTREDEYFPPPRDLRELLRSRSNERLLDDDAAAAASDVLRDLRGVEPASERLALQQLGAYSVPIDRQMDAVVHEEIAEPSLRNAIAYHLGWLDERYEPNGFDGRRPGGKKLRATLAVLAYRATVAAEPGTDGSGAGASAINVGDCVQALAFRCLGRLRGNGVEESVVADLTAELARTAVDLTVGQMRDLVGETSLDVDTTRYLEMIEGKAAALIRCAAYGGALLGSGSREVAHSFGEFGRRLGLGFQMRDDILGIWGTDATTGKPTGSDIRRRKKTLPVVLALDTADPGDRERLRTIYSQDMGFPAEDEAEVKDLLDRCRAQQHAQEHADRHRAAAAVALDAAGDRAGSLAGPHTAALQALAEFVTQRSHNADFKERIRTRTGPPTPDDLDELMSRRTKPQFFFAHPRAIAAFGRECTRRGLYPTTVDLAGHLIPAWRGLPIFPCNKIPISDARMTSILVVRTGNHDRGVVGLHQTGLPDEYEPSLSVRFMSIDERAIISYLVSAYYSVAVLVPDALGVLEDVELGHYD